MGWPPPVIATAVVFIGLNSKDFSIGFDDPQVLRISLGYVVDQHDLRPRRGRRRLVLHVERLATALVIAFPVVVEGALSAVLPGDSGSYLPFAAGNAVLTSTPRISALEGGIIFAAFAGRADHRRRTRLRPPRPRPERGPTHGRSGSRRPASRAAGSIVPVTMARATSARRRLRSRAWRRSRAKASSMSTLGARRSCPSPARSRSGWSRARVELGVETWPPADGGFCRMAMVATSARAWATVEVARRSAIPARCGTG